MPAMIASNKQTGRLIEFEALPKAEGSSRAFLLQKDADIWKVPLFYRSPFSKGYRSVHHGGRQTYTCCIYRFWDSQTGRYRYVEEYQELIPTFFWGHWETQRAELTKDQARHWFAMTAHRNPPTNIIEV